MIENLENNTANTDIQPTKSSSTGVLGSLIFMGIMIGIMIVLSHIMN